MEDEKNKVKEVSRYISKDFSKTGINSLLSQNDFNDLNEFKLYLSGRVKEMMETKFNQLINTLYLIDVNEEKVNELFSAKNRDSVPDKLAELIIERQLQKYYLRQKYKKGEL
ncbi:MAG: hypothetical protein R6W90_18010 [Ignavibacteriaceae bacterium]